MLTFLLLAAVQIAGFILIRTWINKRLTGQSGLESRFSALRDEVESLAADFGEASERNIGLLEDRIAVMRDLLDEADVLVNRASGKEPVSRHDGTEASALSGTPASTGIPAHAEEQRTGAPPAQTLGSASGQESGSSPIILTFGQKQGDTPARGSPGGRESGHSSPSSSQGYRSPRTEALDLYRAGFSADAIAARLGLSVAEVELIVGLEERRGGG